MTRSCIWAAPLVLLSSVISAPFALAYTFTNIADDTGQVRSFIVPAINNSGTVVFGGLFNFGGTGNGVFKGDGGPIAIVADNTGAFSGFGRPSTINSEGTIAILASLDTGPNGVFKIDAGPVITVADSTGPFSQLDIPYINAAGNVVVNTSLDGGGSALIAGSGDPTTTIVSSVGPLGGFGTRSAPTSAGEVVFSATIDAGGDGVFWGNGGPINTIVDSSGILNSFFHVASNATGAVVFAASIDAGESGVFSTTLAGDTLHKIADTSGAFSSANSPAINAMGQVVFRAGLDAGGFGLFSGPDPVVDKVIELGDTLFGSIVTDLTFVAAGFNDLGDVAFSYSLSNGIKGIAVASVESEPMLIGDYSGNGVIDAADYTVWRDNVGAATLPNRDPESSGEVGSTDYEVWKSRFTSAGSGGLAMTVPEPTSALLLTLTSFAALGIRWR